MQRALMRAVAGDVLRVMVAVVVMVVAVGAVAVGIAMMMLRVHPCDAPTYAYGRIETEQRSASGMVVGPQLPDGRWRVLTSAVAVGDVGQVAGFTPRDGKPLDVVVVSVDVARDVAWLHTVKPIATMATAQLADSEPAIDDPVSFTVLRNSAWQSRLGVKREDGYTASVSYGDAGTALFDSRNKIVGLVSTTTGINMLATVRGPTLAQIKESMK